MRRRSNPTSSLLGCLLLGAALPAGAASPVSCHIHPPGSTPERPVNIVGPFDSYRECEQAREARFGAEGRCHCAADFSPRWLDQPRPRRPGESPLG